MRVAVIDVGSNTIHLLVAAASGDGLATLEERQSRVGLGVEIEMQGRISEVKIGEAAATVRDFVATARELGCMRLVVAVTSPGRQAANAAQLIARLEEEAPLAVEVLSGGEEARFAWDGALSWCGPSEGSVLVCDVGGGSTELAFGTPADGLLWRRSLDIGSLRLTKRLLVNDPPGKELIAAARVEVDRELDGLLIPLPVRAVAVGGSARAVSKIAGKRLGAEQFSETLRVLRRWPSPRIAAEFKIDPIRARTVAAGALILTELQRRIAVPLEVVPSGLREGLALSLIARLTRSEVGIEV
jgi:exopolyphosphatase / guanosine-5'-triphosphate,3'-diphosphate pyrophosphatase